ncbi:uncharacterized protein LOC110837667 [Zootermopsis nevadensis]|uniref:uncharacterized protein LOC110837667 n=1 Tax=Zootermopsis nevadensis TaxID=136037 RepID=UPI000B8E7A80|nr:uncharacterized protein LOC110837667 [Zootermopsis nevadensis]
MHSSALLVVFAVVAVLAAESHGAERLAFKGSTVLPTETTAVKPRALSPDLSVHENSASGQSQIASDEYKEIAVKENASDRLDTAATYNSPTQVQGILRNANGQDVYSTFYDYNQPLFLNSRGFTTVDNVHHFVIGASFPYLSVPYLYVGPCSLECEYFAIQHGNTFPSFHHRPLHNLAEYHGPNHHTSTGFQLNGRLPHAILGHNRPEHSGVRHDAGGQVRYLTGANDVNHIKTQPHLLQNRINGQYASQTQQYHQL